METSLDILRRILRLYAYKLNYSETHDYLKLLMILDTCVHRLAFPFAYKCIERTLNSRSYLEEYERLRATGFGEGDVTDRCPSYSEVVERFVLPAAFIAPFRLKISSNTVVKIKQITLLYIEFISKLASIVGTSDYARRNGGENKLLIDHFRELMEKILWIAVDFGKPRYVAINEWLIKRFGAFLDPCGFNIHRIDAIYFGDILDINRDIVQELKMNQ